MGGRSLGVGLLGALVVIVGARDGVAKKKARERVEVAGVVSTADHQHVVILRTKADPVRYLPIWIGEIEALNIRMRLERQKPPRPLTLNLLESVMSTTKVELTEINIDDLRGGVFLGKLHLKQKGRVWIVDARPSDAIGLAVGRGVPIFVSPRVLRDAALDLAEIERSVEPEPPNPPASAPTTGYEETL